MDACRDSFSLLDVVRLPMKILLRARMLVRCVDEQDKRWHQCTVLLTEVSLLLLRPPEHTWRSEPLVHAHVRQDTGSQAEFFELSTAVKTYNFRAKHDKQAQEWVRLVNVVTSLHSDHVPLCTADFMADDWKEARFQEGLLGAAATVMAGDGVRLAPRGVMRVERPSLDVPPWGALTAAARQYGALSGGEGAVARMTGASAAASSDALEMVLPGMAEWAAGAGAEGGALTRRMAALRLLSGGRGGDTSARPPRLPPRLMPGVLSEAVRVTAADAPVVAAHALLQEAAAVAGADITFVQRAWGLGQIGCGQRAGSAAAMPPHGGGGLLGASSAGELYARGGVRRSTTIGTISGESFPAPLGSPPLSPPPARLRKAPSAAAVLTPGSVRYGNG
jgi:hypothetical protein